MSLFRWIARLFAGGRTVAELAGWLGISAKELRSVRIEYSTFHIRKRSGGYRVIHAPHDELKRVQRRILRRVLVGMTAHEAAMAFERGRSIVHNAKPHAASAVVLKMDLVDFFPSIGAARIARFYRRCKWGRAARKLLTDLCTFEGSLPQGAPTSPRLSNLVNSYLDGQLMHLAISFDASYTRYADDITFSFLDDDRRQVQAVLGLTKEILRRAGYRVHRRKKLSVRRAHQRQEVTGLVVNERPQLSRQKRRWLRAVRHRAASAGDATLTDEQLGGWRAYQTMIERQARE